MKQPKSIMQLSMRAIRRARERAQQRRSQIERFMGGPTKVDTGTTGGGISLLEMRCTS